MLSFIHHNKSSSLFLINTNRSNSLILYRTSALNLLWLRDLEVRVNFGSLNHSDNLFFWYAWSTLYIADFYTYFQNFISLNFGLITTNLTNSMYYWNVSVMDNLFSRLPPINNTHNIEITSHNVTLYNPIVTLNFAFHKNPHDTFIFYLYFLLADSYSSPYHDFNLYYSFIYLPQNFNIIPFLNIFYFNLRHF